MKRGCLRNEILEGAAVGIKNIDDVSIESDARNGGGGEDDGTNKEKRRNARKTQNEKAYLFKAKSQRPIHRSEVSQFGLIHGSRFDLGSGALPSM